MDDGLKKLFKSHFGEPVRSSQPLKAHGSNRKLYRLQSGSYSAIGVENSDRAENLAFLTFSRHFLNLELPVPEIYAEDADSGIYLEEDLGNETLFDLIVQNREADNGFSENLKSIYEDVTRFLPQFQIEGGKELNYDVCYPRHSFDQQSIMWDLNYFKYYFLKLAGMPFDEQKLEDDFNAFADFLLKADCTYFLYRDFQSRNIMIRDGKPYFIDYQGGRRGALQYDIASLLFDAKADLPFSVRESLLSTYLDYLGKHIRVHRERFLRYYPGYILIRILQALGAYGFRGFYERKAHFLQSVPYALRNLEYLLREFELPVKLPHLIEIIHGLVRSTRLRELADVQLELTVKLQSFSYKNGLPQDETGHGGGFVFDCRSLPNPGRHEAYKNLTGNDEAVVTFLEKEEEVQIFLSRIQDLISQVVRNYSERNFTHLTVAFGCTGGQHRSVYCANRLREFLSERLGVQTEVQHREIGSKNMEIRNKA